MAPKKETKAEAKRSAKAKPQQAETADSVAPDSEVSLDAKQMKVQQTLFAQVCASVDATAEQKAALERYKYYFQVSTLCLAYVNNISVSNDSDFVVIHCFGNIHMN